MVRTLFSIITSMEEIEMNFKGPILTVKGPTEWIDFVKKHIKQLLNDFADICEMPLQKTCEKLIENEKTQTEFKIMVSTAAMLFI